MEQQKYVWGMWQDSFCKFGYGDGEGEALTAQVAAVLEKTGYEVRYGQWGCHSLLIYSVEHNGAELIPKCSIGYQRPEVYLPEEIISVLNKTFL